MGSSGLGDAVAASWPECSHHQARGAQTTDRRHVTLIASSYPFLDILWTTLIFFAWVIFIWIAITVLIDIFRRDDISGWGKAAWVVFVVILPWIGVLTYLIVNHTGMAERRSQDTQVA